MATFATDTDLLTKLEEHRIPCAPVLDAADALTHPYFVERRMVKTINDPIIGEMMIPGNPLRFSEQPEELDLVTPSLGEHNAQVLGLLGYSPDEIAALEAAGVLRRGDR